MSTLLEQASLVMIPSGYKEDVVYSQIPTNGSGDLSFTRASNGTRVNSAGLVEVTPWNLLQQSETFDNASWSKLGATVTANDITAPNGTLTADKVVFSGANNSIYQAVSLNGEVATRFVYIKGTAGETISIDDIYVSQPNITLTGDWQLIGFTSATPSLRGLGISTYGGATARTIWLWGAQLNIGSTAKPYFPTTDRLNVPRLTYQNGGGGCPSLLLEKQSTNAFSYSEQLDNAYWTPLQLTVTANNTTSPDGTQNAEKFTEDAVSGVHLFYNTNAVVLAATTTASIFYKKGTRRYFSIKLQIGTSSYTQVFDADGLTTGSNSSNGLTSVSTSIVSMGNGWVRASVTGTDPSASTACYMICSLSNSATPTFDSGNFNPSYLGSSSEYGFFWGAQLEASSYPTSYIPTTSASATRVADACFKTGISSLIGQTEGTIFADLVFLNPEPMFFLSIVGTDWLTDSIYFELANSTNYIGVSSVKNASGIGSANSTIAPTANSRYKIAVQYSGTAFNLYINGTKISGTRSANALCSKLYLNELGTLSSTKNNLQTKFNEVVTFTTALSDAECISLTTI